MSMPQDMQSGAALLPMGVNLDRDTVMEDGAIENLRLPTFAQDSDNELSGSQKSSSSLSQLFDFRKLGMRLGSQGSVTDSDDGFFNLSQDSLTTDVDSLLRNVYTRHTDLDRGALFDPRTDAEIPRSETPPPETDASDSLVTPQKSSKSSEAVDPLTPMANLKMLISAASPEIRNRERARQLRQDFEEDEIDCSEVSAPSRGQKRGTKRSRDEGPADEDLEGDAAQPTSRKDKSLGLLCQRFLARYPEYPDAYQSIKISLDEASKDLCVERRRIYDIVNVLESVEIVSRVAKNKYSWHGKTHLAHTLARLKALGRIEGLEDQLNRLKETGLDDDTPNCSPRKKLPFKCNDEMNILGGPDPTYNIRKDKSLGIMSQKFLMLFLVSQPRTVNLDMAAKILIGDPNVEKTESSKFKTKIRRLYDIANILTSLDLIRKVHVTETRGRKPAFQYVGPEIDLLNLEECIQDASHRPTSRHSLLDPVQRPIDGSDMTSTFKAGQLQFTVQENPQSRSGTSSQPAGGAPVTKRPFSRHSSLDQICQVAEQERNRLYFESRSQPTSPVKTKSHPKRSFSTIPTSSLQPTFNKTSDGSKQFVVIRGSKPSPRPDDLPTPDQHVTSDCSQGHEEEVMPVETESTEDSKPTVVTLTRQQLDTIIKTASKPESDSVTSSPGLVNSLLAIVNKLQGNTEATANPEPASPKAAEKRPAVDDTAVEQPAKRARKESPARGIRRLLMDPEPTPEPDTTSGWPTPGTGTPTFRLSTTSPPVMMLSRQPDTPGAPQGCTPNLTPSTQPRIIRRYMTVTRPVASPLAGSQIMSQSVSTPTGRVVSSNVNPQVSMPTTRVVLSNSASQVVTPTGRVVISSSSSQHPTPTQRVVFGKVAPGACPQVMVTPTNNCSASNGIQPSGSIVNLLPYFSSTTTEPVSTRLPVKLVRVSGSPNTLPQMVLSNSSPSGDIPRSVLTPQSAAPAFYYSTPSSVSPTLVGTRVVPTSYTSAFQPVNSTLTARRLSLPKH